MSIQKRQSFKHLTYNYCDQVKLKPTLDWSAIEKKIPSLKQEEQEMIYSLILYHAKIKKLKYHDLPFYGLQNNGLVIFKLANLDDDIRLIISNYIHLILAEGQVDI